MEYNRARPYTYTHRRHVWGANYTHYNQALAHPLGANFQEALSVLHYQLTKRLSLEGRLIYAAYGIDAEGENWGTNLLLPSTSRQSELGNEIGQGIPINSTIAGLDVRYQLFHNAFLELQYFQRTQEVNSAVSTTDRYFGGGFRMNIVPSRMDF